MNMTASTVEGSKALKPVSGTSSYGVGLWTSICLGFANIFGVESKNAAKKLMKAKVLAEKRMLKEAEGYDGVMEVRYVITGLNVLAYGVAYKVEK